MSDDELRVLYDRTEGPKHIDGLRAVRAAALREAVDIAAPERVAFSDDEWRVRCEIADALRARAEGR
ncbi:MAG: hypothetical protein ACK5XA_08640 [Tagaea sp.]